MQIDPSASLASGLDLRAFLSPCAPCDHITSLDQLAEKHSRASFHIHPSAEIVPASPTTNHWRKVDVVAFRPGASRFNVGGDPNPNKEKCNRVLRQSASAVIELSVNHRCISLCALSIRGWNDQVFAHLWHLLNWCASLASCYRKCD